MRPRTAAILVTTRGGHGPARGERTCGRPPRSTSSWTTRDDGARCRADPERTASGASLPFRRGRRTGRPSMRITVAADGTPLPSRPSRRARSRLERGTVRCRALDDRIELRRQRATPHPRARRHPSCGPVRTGRSGRPGRGGFLARLRRQRPGPSWQLGEGDRRAACDDRSAMTARSGPPGPRRLTRRSRTRWLRRRAGGSRCHAASGPLVAPIAPSTRSCRARVWRRRMVPCGWPIRRPVHAPPARWRRIASRMRPLDSDVTSRIVHAI